MTYDSLALVMSASIAVTLVAAVPALAQDAPGVVQDQPAPIQEEPKADDGPRFTVEAYDIVGNTKLDQATIERAVYPFTGEWRTADDVADAVKALQEAYKTKGFETVFVQSPIQRYADGSDRISFARGGTKTSGIITIRVQEATVGRLRVVGAKYTAPSIIKGQVPSVKEGVVPDLPEFQKELTALNSTSADRQITPVLKNGKYPGTIDVDLKVKDGLPFHASAELNNDHSSAQSNLKTSATLKYSNLWQLGHVISGTYAVTPKDRAESEVISGTYLAPLQGTPVSLLAYGYVSNSLTKINIPGFSGATGNGANFEGTRNLGNGFAIGLKSIIKIGASERTTQSLTFGVEFKSQDSTLIIPGVALPSLRPFYYWPANIGYSYSRSGEQYAINASPSITFGLRDFRGAQPFANGDVFEEQRAFAKGNFIRLNFDGDYTQDFKHDITAAVRFNGQYTDSPLVPTEQFNVGGNTTVRGYFQGEALGDEGMVGSIELRSPSVAKYFGRHVDEWRFFGFIDGGYAHIRKALPDQEKDFGLMSLGFGTRIKAFKYLDGDVSLAFPMRDSTNTKSGDKKITFGVKAEF